MAFSILGVTEWPFCHTLSLKVVTKAGPVSKGRDTDSTS